MKTICVVGAGVIGLSSAVRILDRFPNIDITVIADKFTPHTTSDGAGALLEVYAVGDTPLELVQKWGNETWDHLKNLTFSVDAGSARVQQVSGYWVSSDPQVILKTNRDGENVSRRLTREEMQLFPQAKSGQFFTTYLVDCTSYLPWLMKRAIAVDGFEVQHIPEAMASRNHFETWVFDAVCQFLSSKPLYINKGGKIINKTIQSLDELYPLYDIIINCSGLHSHQLLGDKELFPARGETIRVIAPWIKQLYIQEIGEEITYILPGSKNVVLGGTCQKGNWDKECNQKDRSALFERCCQILPSLKMATVDYSWVGLRPCRSRVRLELEPRSAHTKCRVIHNYGHGGAGIALHWGCAQTVVDLIQDLMNNTPINSKL